MKQFDLYDALGIIAMIATPMAAALVFGWELYLYFLSITVPMALAVSGAIAGAVAMESVGVYAGHVGIDYARRRDMRGLVAAAAMVFYIWFGWSKAPTYGAVFVLAGFVYALVALRHEAKEIDGQTAVLSKEDRNWEKRVQMEKLRMAHDEKLARIAAAKAAQPVPVAETSKATVMQPVLVAETSGNLTPAQLRVLEVVKSNPGATHQQLADELGITRQAVGKQIKSLNGHVKELTQ